jgi:hypothetical protein
MGLTLDFPHRNTATEQGSRSSRDIVSPNPSAQSADINTSIGNLFDRSTMEQFRRDVGAELKQLHLDAKSVVAELFTPLSDFSDFINSDPSADVGSDLDTGNQKGLEKERKERTLQDMLDQATAPIIKGELLLSNSQTDNSLNTKTIGIVGSIVAGATTAALEANRQEDLQQQEVQEVLSQYSSALANNPSLAGEIAASIPPGADRATIEQVVRNYVASAQSAQKSK